MTIDFTLLDQVYAPLVHQLIIDCAAAGYNLVPYYGYRSLQDQAKLWRRSRTSDAVNSEIASLRAQGCDYLASVVDNVGPQSSGPWATNAIPGLSWHNWGQAVDFYWQMENNRVNWDGDGVGYKILGQQANLLGLKWGGEFSTPDYDHVQMNKQEIPKIYSLKYVNDYFEGKST